MNGIQGSDDSRKGFACSLKNLARGSLRDLGYSLDNL
jgi:hypothetical protein